MTRHVRDAALMLNVMSRPDHRDPYALPPEDRDWRDGIEDGVRGLKIAYSPDLGYARVDTEIAAAAAAAARQFEALGATVEEVREVFPSPREALLTLWAAGEARVLAGLPAEKHKLCDPGLAAMAALGQKIGAVDYLGADVARTMLGVRMGEFHERYDLLLTPMMPVPALPVGQDLNDPAYEEQWFDWSPFSYPFNMTRQPAASIPCGLTSAGLPIGLQIVGPLYAEDRVLRAARAFEQTQPVRRPSI
jgi:aspartyl-tRNA(Asn)/glutamyl-tRNA(Gln) amidotransferase subunit A